MKPARADLWPRSLWLTMLQSLMVLLPCLASQPLAAGEVREAVLKPATVPYYRTHVEWQGFTPIDAPDTSRPITADPNGWFEHEDLLDGSLTARIDSPRDQVVLLEVRGPRYVDVNGIRRVGNFYATSDTWESWEPRFDYARIPVRLHTDENTLVAYHSRTGRVALRWSEPKAPLLLNLDDVTLPDLVIGEPVATWGAVTLINATDEPVENALLRIAGGGLETTVIQIGYWIPLGIRKIPFHLLGPAPTTPDPRHLTIELVRGQSTVDAGELVLEVRAPQADRKRTFRSELDGSVQYYSLLPASGPATGEPRGLILSLHGAGVVATNQTASYAAKPWAHLVAPTNRRPYGWNWEEWGRHDAFEALADAERYLKDVDPRRICLTGHSMGGHGVWHLGSLFPDRFAALGPSAGWISFWSYRSRGVDATGDPPPILAGTLPSRTLRYTENLARQCVYVLHGEADDNVLPEESRSMVEALREAPCLTYHEQPEAGHWWDLEGGAAECVDWEPMMERFETSRSLPPDSVRHVVFTTPSPGVSASSDWVEIVQQHTQDTVSRVDLSFVPPNVIAGHTDNVRLMALDPPVPAGVDTLLALTRPATYLTRAEDGRFWVRQLVDTHGWMSTTPASPTVKRPARYGGFKDVLRNQVLFVYGTGGSAREQAWALDKARFDAEFLWYQGNSAVQVVPDTHYQPSPAAPRNVVLYGNADTNSAWEVLLGHSPLQVRDGSLRLGDRELSGPDRGVLLVYPRQGSDNALVGVVGGTGIAGMELTANRPAMHPGFPYPDWTILRPSDSSRIIEGTGFFDMNWTYSAARGDAYWAPETQDK